jgi:hypothetical protein
MEFSMVMWFVERVPRVENPIIFLICDIKTLRFGIYLLEAAPATNAFWEIRFSGLKRFPEKLEEKKIEDYKNNQQMKKYRFIFSHGKQTSNPRSFIYFRGCLTFKSTFIRLIYLAVIFFPSTRLTSKDAKLSTPQ